MYPPVNSEVKVSFFIHLTEQARCNDHGEVWHGKQIAMVGYGPKKLYLLRNSGMQSPVGTYPQFVAVWHSAAGVDIPFAELHLSVAGRTLCNASIKINFDMKSFPSQTLFPPHD